MSLGDSCIDSIGHAAVARCGFGRTEPALLHLRCEPPQLQYTHRHFTSKMPPGAAPHSRGTGPSVFDFGRQKRKTPRSSMDAGSSHEIVTAGFDNRHPPAHHHHLSRSRRLSFSFLCVLIPWFYDIVIPDRRYSSFSPSFHTLPLPLRTSLFLSAQSSHRSPFPHAQCTYTPTLVSFRLSICLSISPCLRCNV